MATTNVSIILISKPLQRLCCYSNEFACELSGLLLNVIDIRNYQDNRSSVEIRLDLTRNANPLPRSEYDVKTLGTQKASGLGALQKAWFYKGKCERSADLGSWL